MSAKAIREYDGKLLLNYFLPKTVLVDQSDTFHPPSEMATLEFDMTIASNQQLFDSHVDSVFSNAERAYSWLKTQSLVCKPDQLIKRRGKNGLLGINLSWEAVKEWIRAKAGTQFKLEKTVGFLHTFLVEPLVPHAQDTEYYVCIQAERDGDMILFTHEGGVDIGDVDAKAQRLFVAGDEALDHHKISSTLLSAVPAAKRETLSAFIAKLFAVYSELQFTYLEINPLVVIEGDKGGPSKVYYLDLAAKLDQTAEFECGKKWSLARQTAYAVVKPNIPSWGPPMEFPAPFGREMTKEEAYIADLDAKTGASLKLTILNQNGRLWTMVAGGGASVVYTDAIAAHGYANEIANYGEYSGAPSESQTFEYAKTILDLMTRGPVNPLGKILFIGGGIANFTNVAATFKGIIKALQEFQRPIQNHLIRIFVRRAGPNYQEGLRLIRDVGESLGLDMHVFGPEMFVTGIVPLALKGDAKGISKNKALSASASSIIDHSPSTSPSSSSLPDIYNVDEQQDGDPLPLVNYPTGSTNSTSQVSQQQPMPFTNKTRAIVYGMQPRAVQGMLDFDFMCKRERPSVACMVYPFGGHHVQKFYWGTKETLLPVYTTLDEAISKFPDVDVVCNFASCRSVYESTMEIMNFSQFRTIAIIAEGVPEQRARQILRKASEKNVLVIGPATVGGIKPGCFKIGNTGGMMDNVVASKLYRPGSVAYVSKSGGMSNELNNIISQTTDGVYEGVAIGGDRYPGSTFIDHMLRYEADANCKIMVLLGEVGGIEEYRISEAIKAGKIRKPVVAWCIGTCSDMFSTDVQFGHAGSFANSNLETANAKNSALRDAGAFVPGTFEDFPLVLSRVFKALVKQGIIQPRTEPEIPRIPVDYSWAQELGLVRKPASFISTICDDRGQELVYAGMAISEIFKEDVGVGGVLSLLWFKRRLPAYATKFIEMVLMLTADHGPAVSGAHNTIVTARAGKDLISSLVSGLLTIGERFGGALDGAAQLFSKAYDSGQSPQEFVDSMRKKHQLILGIGHKIKSRTNPDLRVEIVKQFVLENFPSAEILKYAIQVEKITTCKKDNLILNVDGAVGAAFVDLLRGCGAFSREETEEYINIGTLNGLFVLGRSIGFVGHYLDQKRLKQGLYRHPWDDISYMIPEGETHASGANVAGSGGRTFVEGDAVLKKGAASSK